MSVTWVSSQELMETARRRLTQVRTVLDIGCGIRPQQMLKPLIHICCEPFSQYVDKLLNDCAGVHDRNYVILNAGWREAVELFPQQSVDTVFLIDVVEHLEKDEALELLHRTQALARRQVVIFTPLGFMPQVHDNGKDAWGMDGVAWQEHRSGWLPEDFDASWEVIVAEEFHTVDSLLRKLETPYGALWAIWTCRHAAASGAARPAKLQLLHALLDKLYDLACRGRNGVARVLGRR